MSRPVDWWVLELEDDPTPGSPVAVRRMVRSWSGLADDAEYAETRIRQLMGDEALGSWIGEAGDAFRAKTGDLPAQLGRCKDSYRLASEALTWWATRLETHQGDADAALVRGRAARDDLEAARARASAAAAAVSGAANVGVLTNPALEPTPEQVRDARARLSSARAARSSADAAVEAARARLDQARALALDAKALREADGRSTAATIHEASDAGIPERSRWDKFKDWASEAWDVVVTVAKVVVAVLGIVALIIGGPLAWVVFAAALLLLADAIMKYHNGEGSMWDVAWAAVGAIPGTKGLTTLAALRNAFRTDGALGALAHVGGALRTAGTQLLRMTQRFRQGALPAVTRVVGDLPSLVTSARAADGFVPSLRVFWNAARSSASGAVDAAWTAHIAQVGRTDPARAASLWQGSGSYPGVDNWRKGSLSPGTVVEAGWPGTSGFTIPDGTIASVGNDAGRLADGTQVAPDFDYNPPLRSDAMRFQVNVEVPAATSTTAANPQYGQGGLTQHYIPDFNAQVADGGISAIDGSGQPVAATLNKWGGLQLDLPNGTTIHMTNPFPTAGVPSGVEVAGQGYRLHHFAPWAATPWRLDQVGGQ
ncbi:MAG TPA: hypothetical protein VFG72_16490 [Marmoricola sp.]|nr:hypothetical protein [Marmoricola sp.]